TAYLKTFGWDQRYKAGLEYVADFARDYFVVIGLAIVGILLARQRTQLSLLAAYLAYVAYIAYIGGDAFPHFRFFVPVLPLLLTLAFLGFQTFELTRMLRYLQEAFKQRSLRTVIYLALFISGLILIALSLVSGFMSAKAIQGLGTRAFLSLTLGFGLIIGGLVLSYRQEAPIHSLQQSNSLRALLLFLSLLSTPLIVPEHYRGFLESNAADIGNIRIGLLLKQNTLPDSKVADFWAGSVFYFSERYGIDLLGKSDRYIARLPVSSNGSKPGHNKFDFDYSLGVLKPDFVIANFSLPVQEKKMRRAATGDWAFTGQLYFHQVFREHCLRYPVNLRTWRTIFVCDWSPQVNNRNQWKELPHSVK
ncbi:MAG: hypothetical protein RML93_09555, partial [Anaerolineales bacterium]|nr:hypothetical protein [Anaerolineales bacterium]MDW8447521.1 hypothetical protein [Anaerolineales bacterium]